MEIRADQIKFGGGSFDLNDPTFMRLASALISLYAPSGAIGLVASGNEINVGPGGISFVHNTTAGEIIFGPNFVAYMEGGTFDINGAGAPPEIDGNFILTETHIDTDITLAANSDVKVPSQKAIKAYADAIKQGLYPKDAVRALTLTNINLSSPGSTVGGVIMAVGQRFAAGGQTTGSQNGIYIWNGAAVAATRSLDANVSAEVKSGLYFYVSEGTSATTGWVLTTADPITLDTTVLTFTQFSGAGQITAGAALTKSGNTLDVAVDGVGIEISADALRLKNAGVTLAKMANMATASLLGRNTAGTGVPEVLSAAIASAILQGTGLITDAVGFRTIPQNSQSAAYTLVAADSGKHVLHPSADTTARIWTIPANASVAFPVGTAITFVNQNAAGIITIAITTDTMRLAGAGTTGNRTLAANGIATALKVTTTEWIISGTGLT